MATTEEGDERRSLRTVTRFVDERPNREMNVIGWLIFLGLMVVVLPLALAVGLVWLVWRVIGT